MEGARIEGVVSDKDARFQAFCQVGGERGASSRGPHGLTVVGKGAQVLQGVRVGAGGEIPIKQVVTSDWERQNRPQNLLMA